MDDTGRRARGQAWGLWLGPASALTLWLAWRPDTTLDPAALAVVGGLALWMAIWWMTEAVAIPVTSLLPMVVLPWMIGAPLDLARVAANYANWRVFLFFGGFLIAIAMEVSGLHRRVALLTVSLIGTQPRRLVLGFMVAAAVLSMWVSNTATALMMLPIGKAVAECFDDRRFGIALLLGIAYASSLGGVATPIGTPPNIAFSGIYSSLYPLAPTISFADWMAFALPLVIVFLPLAWLVLVWRLPAGGGDAGHVLERQIADLGIATSAERRVLVIFGATAVLWVFRQPLQLGPIAVPGWADWFPAQGINDGVVAVTMALLLFLIPAGEGGRTLLDWRTAERKMPWGILVLFGGGFALADAVGATGVAEWVGGHLEIPGMTPLLLVLGSAVLLTFLTEVTSNTATAQVMLPIAAAVATTAVGAHPLVAMLPVTVAASFAFMLPVATPPNAVIFGSGAVPMREMVRHGLVLNLVGIALLTLFAYLFAPWVFGFDPAVVPPWAAN